MFTKTINYEIIKEFFNGKVKIRKLKTYDDDRGMVSEIFRLDSDITNDCKMCYISETLPFVQRGPHLHEIQRDEFIIWKSIMLYQMYCPLENKMEYFITNSTDIINISIEPGIIHSYINLSTSNQAITCNFPTSLFMGKDKKGFSSDKKIDEIRHEDIVKNEKTIYILGANGRLGKALTNQLISDMGYHNYTVIPIYEKLIDNNVEIVDRILNLILKNKKPNDIIINCIAKTNVYSEIEDFEFANFIIPKYITKFCIKNKIYFIHFSTDYVFQTGEISNYTASKKLYEEWLNNIIYNEIDYGYNINDIKKYIKILRVSNLFSKNIEDTRNVINKLFNARNDCRITSDIMIMPTSVEELSKFISNNYINNLNTFDQITNVFGNEIYLHDFLNMYMNFVKYKIITSENKVQNNINTFLNSSKCIRLNCTNDIIEKINSLKGN